MNQTTSKFLRELKAKPLDQYKMDELQKLLQQTYNLYKRFRKVDERAELDQVWRKMATWYNKQLKTKHPQSIEVYLVDYLKNNVK